MYTCEFGVYVKKGKGADFLFVVLYVDVLHVIGSSDKEVQEFKRKIMDEFKMTDLGHLSYFFGIEFERPETGIIMSQRKYGTDLLKRFNMANCNPAETPAKTGLVLVKDGDEELVDATQFRQMVGSLRYLCNTRPNLSYSVGLISRSMEKPRISHFLAAKRIKRYVKGTLDFGILFHDRKEGSQVEIYGYSDADWSGDKDDRKSAAG